MGLLVLQKPLLLGPGPVGLQAPPLGLQGVLHPGQVAEEGLGLRGVGPGGEVQPGAEEVEGPLQRPPQAHLQAGKVQVGPRSLFQEEAHPVASGKPGPEGRLPLAVRAEASGLVPSGGLQAAGGAGAEGRPQDPRGGEEGEGPELLPGEGLVEALEKGGEVPEVLPPEGHPGQVGHEASPA